MRSLCMFVVLPRSMRVDNLRVQDEGLENCRHYDDCYPLLAVAHAFGRHKHDYCSLYYD